MNKLRVAILFGGRSGEHEVSIVSARSVVSAIDKNKYEVILIGISKSGKFLLADESLLNKDEITDKIDSPQVILSPNPEHHGFIMVKRDLKRSVCSINGGKKRLGTKEKTKKAKGEEEIECIYVDVIFPVMHGQNGEDGTIQGICELANIPYVGAGVLASSTGMDKAIMKFIFKANNIPIGNFMVVKRKNLRLNEEKIIKKIEENFAYPCFVKPACLGSSVGISKAHNTDELRESLWTAAKYDRKIVVEEFISGRECECSVLGNDNPIASVVGEIIPCNEFYDYNAKYLDEKSKLIIPAELPINVMKKIQKLAIESFLAIDCAGMARVDFFVTPEMNLFVNEINTIPGFTKISMYPKLWEASGISYTDLITLLIELAIERHKDKNQSLIHYERSKN